VGLLNGKTAIITGAPYGIGAAISLEFAQQGANLILHWYESEEDAKGLAEECRAHGVSCDLIYADFTKREEIVRMIETIEARATPVDVLVNNAYAPGDVRFPDEYGGWEDVIAVNLTATAHLCHWAVGSIREGGSIINITSIQAMFAGEYSWAYGATKSALEQLTKRVAVEGGSRGIRANAIRPGLIITERNARRWTEEEPQRLKLIEDVYPLRRVGAPEDVAPVCAFLASDGSRFVTGASIPVDGGLAIVNAALGSWHAYSQLLSRGVVANDA
jgi:3-oxoacyl-[acyl-carrier protein] reductase